MRAKITIFDEETGKEYVTDKLLEPCGAVEGLDEEKATNVKHYIFVCRLSVADEEETK